jgi:hypothetical protein
MNNIRNKKPPAKSYENNLSGIKGYKGFYFLYADGFDLLIDTTT